MAFGLVLVIIGVIVLLESLGFTQAGFDELWPLTLIGLGLLIIYERARRWRRSR